MYRRSGRKSRTGINSSSYSTFSHINLYSFATMSTIHSESVCYSCYAVDISYASYISSYTSDNISYTSYISGYTSDNHFTSFANSYLHNFIQSYVPVLSASSAVLGNSSSQEPHDITLANTLFEQAPSQILSVHSDIGIHVPHNIKEKIQRSEYIDLCTLLSNNPNKKKTQKLTLGRKGDNDDAVTGASKQLKSSSIDDVEILHASPVSKAVRVKPNV